MHVVREFAVIGFGRLGGSIALSLHERGHVVSAIATTNKSEVAELLPKAFVTSSSVEAAKKASVIIIATPDRAIPEVAAEIASAVSFGDLVVHLSGATPLDALDACQKAGADVAIIHPLQTFSTRNPQNFIDAPVGVTASDSNQRARANALVEAIGGRPFDLPEEVRDRYHAAAVLASAGVGAFAVAAQNIFSEIGLAPLLLEPLATRSLENALRDGPSALTGPGVRGDAETIGRNQKALREPMRTGYDAAMAIGAHLQTTETLQTAEPRQPTRARQSPKIITSKHEFRRACFDACAMGMRNGFVPTMGALHEGHASLITQARSDCDFVAVSIYVNPTQFNQSSDLTQYPHTPQQDVELCTNLGVNVIFAPTNMYDARTSTSTTIKPRENLVARLEGATRKGHFEGVALVVAKLFALFGQGTAYFGQKDFQQLKVVEALALDLDCGVEVLGMPTVRDKDGLALSSRNVRLGSKERVRALSLYQALQAVVQGAQSGTTDPRELEAIGLKVFSDGFDSVDYFEICDSDTLQPAKTITGNEIVLGAGHLAGIRLIDNEYTKETK